MADPYPSISFTSAEVLSTTPPSVAVAGEVTTYVTPATDATLTVDGTPVPITWLADGGLDVWMGQFSTTVEMPSSDMLINATVTNALGNYGTAKARFIATINDAGQLDPPHYASCCDEDLWPTPSGGFTPSMHHFTVQVLDPTLSITDTPLVELDSGVEVKYVEVAWDAAWLDHRSQPLLLVPENADFPGSVPQDVLNRRIRGRLGEPLRVRHRPVLTCTAEDTALTTGAMLVDADTGAPVDKVWAALPKDLLADGAGKRLKVLVGAPGNAPPGGGDTLTADLEARDFRDNPPSTDQTPEPDWETSLTLTRASMWPGEDEYNLFQSDPSEPLVLTAYDKANIPPPPTLTLANAWPGGFMWVHCDIGPEVVHTVEPVRAEMVVNVLVDGLGVGLGGHPPGTPNFQTLLASGQLPNFATLIGDHPSAAQPVGTYGVQRYDAHTTFPSITFSAWASWATGIEPHAHGVTGSNFFRRDPTNDPFWGGDAEMDLPKDHVSFHGTWPILDMDVEDVWSTLGTLNSAIRPYELPQGGNGAVTIHEAACTVGLTSAVVDHQVWRGARWLEDPGTVQGWLAHDDPVASDRATADEVNNLFACSWWWTKVFPPNLLTVCFSGLDVDAHLSVPYPGGDHVRVTDKFLGVLVRRLEEWNLMDGAMFAITGDHGMTAVVDDDTHSLMLETMGDEELQAVFDAAGYDVLDNAWIDGQYNAVVGLNGGMAHVYVRNRATDNWADVPRYVEDVLPIAQRFWDNNASGIDETTLVGSLRLILVRDAQGGSVWGQRYRVFQGGTSTLSLEEALAVIEPERIVPEAWVDFVGNINAMTGWRSGDVVLLPRFCGDDEGYYFGTQFPGWHGSLCDTDMIIPIVFSYPRGTGPARTAFKDAINATLVVGTPDITDTTPLVHKLLTAEVSHDASEPSCAFSP